MRNTQYVLRGAIFMMRKSNDDAELDDFGRFSEPALLILVSLAEEPRHGYSMTEDIESIAGVRLGPGTLYGALARLEARGLADFEIMIAAKPAERGDVMYVAGCLFRAAGFMTFVLYAMNRRFFLNEKGALAESRGFAIKPARFHDTVASVLGRVGTTPSELSASVAGFQSLAAELRQLVTSTGMS